MYKKRKVIPVFYAEVIAGIMYALCSNKISKKKLMAHCYVICKHMINAIINDLSYIHLLNKLKHKIRSRIFFFLFVLLYIIYNYMRNVNMLK